MIEKRTTNQDIQILFEIKKIMEDLLNGVLTQIEGITIIKEILMNNLHLGEKISEIIIEKFYEVKLNLIVVQYELRKASYFTLFN